jgi:hypothetical protein
VAVLNVYFIIGTLTIMVSVINIKNPYWMTVITVIVFLGVHCGFVIEVQRKLCVLTEEGTNQKF